MKTLRFLITAVLCVFIPPVLAFADADDTEREGGILGTGILGTITELGSIYVNGQHIRFDPDFLMTDGVSVENASSLLPGHTVAVIAHQEDEEWRASYIRQVLPLVGPLQITADGRMSVMGTNVVAPKAGSGDMSVGMWVAVSGLWQGDQVLATRIDKVTPNVGARVEGTALGFDGEGGLRIGGTDIKGIVPRHIVEGDVVRVEGAPTSAGIEAAALETGVFDGEPGVVLVEGFLSPPNPSGLYTVLGSNMVSFTDNPSMINPEIRYLACGQKGRLSGMVDQSQDLSVLSECWPQAD